MCLAFLFRVSLLEQSVSVRAVPELLVVEAGGSRIFRQSLAPVLYPWPDNVKMYPRTNGPVNAHLILWPCKAQNIQNLENIW